MAQKQAEKYHVIGSDYQGFGSSSMPPVNALEEDGEVIDELIIKFLAKVVQPVGAI